MQAINIYSPDQSLAALLASWSPFAFSSDDRREAGNTECRSLQATARAFHTWRERYPTR